MTSQDPNESGGPRRPTVAPAQATGGAWPLFAGAAALGLIAFLWLSHQRHPAPEPSTARKPPAVEATLPPSELAQIEAAARGQSTPPAAAAPAPVVLPASVAPAPLPTAASPIIGLGGDSDRAQRLKSPLMIVDLLASPAGPSAAPSGEKGEKGEKSEGGKAGGASRLSGEEQFAERVGAGEPDQARASALRNKAQVVPQGAIIPAVLETALNSDLPGFARAVVSRDVRGFDGSAVLIPRGSRLIGQYKSGVSQGQSRVFVIWTRLIRPDGVSIQIGSPAADTLGRAGLDGTVDRHFIERFTGSILLSVVNAGVASLFHGPNTQIVIGSSQEAAGLAATIAPPTVIPPTIKAPQGTPVRVFVARDLDFSSALGAES
ncbi:MAG: TrbI/VirB10 family protein [Caulobacteraceae bacterium]|nr:TrbI/VirB10 family protein [Caulobacteraceae bacterium]